MHQTGGERAIGERGGLSNKDGRSSNSTGVASLGPR